MKLITTFATAIAINSCASATDCGSLPRKQCRESTDCNYYGRFEANQCKSTVNVPCNDFNGVKGLCDKNSHQCTYVDGTCCFSSDSSCTDRSVDCATITKQKKCKDLAALGKCEFTKRWRQTPWKCEAVSPPIDCPSIKKRKNCKEHEKNGKCVFVPRDKKTPWKCTAAEVVTTPAPTTPAPTTPAPTTPAPTTPAPTTPAPTTPAPTTPAPTTPAPTSPPTSVKKCLSTSSCRYCHEADAKDLAVEMGYDVSGCGSVAFSGNYGTHGLYAYNSSNKTYGGCAYFSTPEDDRNEPTSGSQIRIGNYDCCMETSSCTYCTEDDAKELALEMGFKVDAHLCGNVSFSGNFDTPGLYAYAGDNADNSPRYKGCAFFSTKEGDRNSELKDNYYGQVRIGNYSCPPPPKQNYCDAREAKALADSLGYKTGGHDDGCGANFNGPYAAGLWAYAADRKTKALCAFYGNKNTGDTSGEDHRNKTNTNYLRPGNYTPECQKPCHRDGFCTDCSSSGCNACSTGYALVDGVCTKTLSGNEYCDSVSAKAVADALGYKTGGLDDDCGHNFVGSYTAGLWAKPKDDRKRPGCAYYGNKAGDKNKKHNSGDRIGQFVGDCTKQTEERCIDDCLVDLALNLISKD